MTVYTKKINRFVKFDERFGHPDIVFAVEWYLVGTDGEFSSFWPFSHDFKFEEGQDPIPFAELTEEQVGSWIDAKMDPQALADAQAKIEENITRQKEIAALNLPPPTIAPPLESLVAPPPAGQ